jgi:hypothetical protein
MAKAVEIETELQREKRKDQLGNGVELALSKCACLSRLHFGSAIAEAIIS